MSSYFTVFYKFHVVCDHQSDLKGQGVLKHSDIQPGLLLDLLQPVDERIPVDEKAVSLSPKLFRLFSKKFINCG